MIERRGVVLLGRTSGFWGRSYLLSLNNGAWNLGSGKSTSKKPASRKNRAKRETTRRKPSVKEKPGFHTPFEEFSAPTLEDLLALVDKMRPPESVVEVSPVQDTPHVVCMMPLTHILVHSAEGSENHAETVYAMYQYCPHCKLAVRVL